MNAQPREPEPLGLRRILPDTLPPALLTDEAPERYTVEAVLTRRAEPDEASAIRGAETAAYFAENGYPHAQIRVSDRRLEIIDTSLEELKGGLATVIANRLAEIDSTLTADRAVAAARIRVLADREKERAASVAALAESVSFLTGPVAASSDSDQTQSWDNEGGHARRQPGGHES